MSSVTHDYVNKLFPLAPSRHYGAGQIVVYHGDQPNYVFFVTKGVYKFHDSDQDGNEKIMHIGGPPDFFPLFYTVYTKDHVDAFYSTVTACDFIMIPLDAFRHQLKTNSSFAYEIITWYAHDMDQMVLRLKSMEKSTATHKLAQALRGLLGVRSHKLQLRSDWHKIGFPISQQTLASYAGMTRETVNSTLKEFEKSKIVRMPKKMILEINMQNLTKLLENL